MGDWLRMFECLCVQSLGEPLPHTVHPWLACLLHHLPFTELPVPP